MLAQALYRGQFPGGPSEPSPAGQSQGDGVHAAELEPQTQAWDVQLPDAPDPPAAARALQPAPAGPPTQGQLQWHGGPIPPPMPTAGHKRFYKAVQLPVGFLVSTAAWLLCAMQILPVTWMRSQLHHISNALIHCLPPCTLICPHIVLDSDPSPALHSCCRRLTGHNVY